MMFFNEYSKDMIKLFNKALRQYIKGMKDAPQTLIDSMKYSLLAGGKRLRPRLFMEGMAMYGKQHEDGLPFAIAIEMIHTYSLIHDDLPCMDNDEYRRGKLTNHKVFGEDVAVLTGDALLNLAHEIMIEECLKDNDINKLKAMKYISNCSGYQGMVAGQILDMESEKGDSRSERLLEKIEVNKTGKLIMASIVGSAIYCGIEDISKIEEFALNFGVMFQIVDDVQDFKGSFKAMGKAVGKDKDANKLTAVKIYGENGSVKLVNKYKERCFDLLRNWGQPFDYYYDVVYNQYLSVKKYLITT